MKNIMRTLFLLSLVLIAVNCKKELSFSNEGNFPPNTTPPAPITATVQGIIFDENNQPATGVMINAGGKTATTDNKGFFNINKALLDKNTSVVTADKSGYFKAYRSFHATAGSNYIVIKLIKKVLAGAISNSGGSVTLSNGSKISLPANAVIKKAGGNYSGSINVYAAYIDPTASDIGQTIPGSFMADDKNGKRVTLESYGMLAVELESASGEKLQIAEGKTAQLTAPIPASLLPDAPAAIAMWYVDEQTGIWKEQGVATKTGSNYVGNVNHFTFWNYDAYFPAINLSFTLKTPSGNPLSNTCVWITRGVGGGANGYTNQLGAVSGLVPANEYLNLQVESGCGNIIFTQSIGPFAQNTFLGDIIVNAPNNILNIQGKLFNCAGLPVTNGTAIIYNNTYLRYANTNSNGDFSISFANCNNANTFTLLGVDNTTQQQGTTGTYTINGPIINVGNILACGNSSAEFINYTLDGINYSMVSADTNNIFNAYRSTYLGSIYSVLSGQNNVNYKNVYLDFVSNTMTNGTYPLRYIGIQNYFAGTFTGPSTVTINNFPQNVNEFYEGNFTTSFMDSTTSINHNASGVFRLRTRN